MRTDFSKWFAFLNSWVIPAFSLAQSTAGLSNELWTLVGALPLAKRYELYGMWDNLLVTGKPTLPTVVSETGSSSAAGSQPINMMSMSLDEALDDDDDDDEDAGGEDQSVYVPMVEFEVLASTVRRDILSVMRRLSVENARDMGRKLCQHCHATPTLSLMVILSQVSSYDNLVEPVVRAFRYLSPLDADILFYLIISMVDDPKRDKLKPDNVNPAHWLQSLAAFVAAYSHRYEHSSLGYLLEYLLKRMLRVVRKIENKPVHELVIVAECIRCLAGIESLSSPTEDQILALQGGPRLRLEAYSINSSWHMPADAS
ncbi:THO2 plays a role in transcriptional elongation, partial [Linderina macrospora]